MKEEYQCAMCKKTYQKEWDDSEAIKECEQKFGVNPMADDESCVIVCDICYEKMGLKNG